MGGGEGPGGCLQGSGFGAEIPTKTYIARSLSLVRSPVECDSVCELLRVQSQIFGAVLGGRGLIFGRKHPSRDVIFSGQRVAKKCQKLSLSLYMTSLSL